jgi:trehalose/maltose transport system substrate-binding protein
VRLRTVLSGGAAALMAALVVGCGSSSSKGSGVTINWWTYDEPSGSFVKAADACTKGSNGAYHIKVNLLGKDADTQRQQLVRRLAAKDPSIDLMSMDVVWTGEFGKAGWVKPWPAKYADQVRKGTLTGPLKTATFNGRLYAAPANSNTQLLWYRKDLDPHPPTTWDGLIDKAQKLKTAGRIEIQGAAYEGLTVWFNALVASAGGQILDAKGQPAFNQASSRAAGIMRKLARSSAADPSLSVQKEDQNRIAFESGAAAYEVNYPFVYPSARDSTDPAVKKIFKSMAWAPYPKVDSSHPLRAPIGGFNWGVAGSTRHPDQAFQAASCLRNEHSQRLFANLGGLPPTLSAIYDDPKFVKAYPFAKLIRSSLENGGPRPASPQYADISLSIDNSLTPLKSIDVKGIVKKLSQGVKDALNSEALL